MPLAQRDHAAGEGEELLFSSSTFQSSQLISLS